MPKLLHTFCCCVARPNPKSGGAQSSNHHHRYRDRSPSGAGKPYKQTNLEDAGPVNPASIITQVTKGDETMMGGMAASDGKSGRPHPATAGGGGGAAAAPVTEGQTSGTSPLLTAAAGGGGGAGGPISVTSPLPTEQFVLSGTPAAIADFKQKEKYKDSLLPVPHSHDQHKKCLIVDLDETLVHSSFKPVKNADFIIPVEIDNVVHQVYVLKRPYADEFLERIGTMFECVLFTASLAKYADPVADLLDKRGTFRARLFREACVFFGGNYVKDLDRLGRDLEKVVIIDNSPASYAFHPENAVPVRTWFDDPHDCELLEMLPLLEEIAESPNIYHVLQRISGPQGQTPYGGSGYGSIPISMTTTISYNNNSCTQIDNKRGNNNNNNNDNNNYDSSTSMTTITTTTVTTSSSLPIAYGKNNNNNNNNGSRTFIKTFGRRDNNNRGRADEHYNNQNNNNAQIPIYGSNNNNRAFNNNNNESRFRIVDEYSKR